MKFSNLSDIENVKVSLAQRAGEIIAEKGWSQREAAKELGIIAAKVNQICQAKDLKGISLEKLLTILEALGEKVTISVGD